MVTAESEMRFRALDWMRYAAVLAVMLNHFSSTLLHFPTPLFGPGLYVEPAHAGITFLFVSSGFILHWRYGGQLQWRRPGQIASFLARRLWVLAPPVLLVTAMDLFAGSTAIETRAGSVAVALPAFATLTQSWTFETLGNVTTVFPWGAANLAWLASDLFFMYLLYLLVFPAARALPVRAAIGVGLVLVLVQLGVFFGITGHPAAFLAEAGKIWGTRAVSPETPAAYSVLKWLTFYSPYARAVEFLIGVALAQICRASNPFCKRWRVTAGLTLVIVGAASYGLHFDSAGLVVSAFRYDCLASGLVLLGVGGGRINQHTLALESFASFSLQAFDLAHVLVRRLRFAGFGSRDFA